MPGPDPAVHEDGPAVVADPARRPPGLRRLFPVVAVCLGGALTLGGAEALLRVQEAVSPYKDRDTTGAAPIAGGNPTALPLRGPRYRFGPSQFRIVTLGDSFTWGDGIWAHEDVWPNRLEAVLAERSGRPVGVVNLAVRGYTAVASARALERHGMPLEPELILYGFYLNDALRNLPDERCLLWDYDLYANLTPDPFHRWGDAYSALYRRANAGWMAYQIRTDPVGWNRHYTEGTVEWAQFKGALRKMAELAWPGRTPVVVVLWPDWGAGDIHAGQYRWEGLYAKVAATAAGYGIHVLDLTPVFAATGRPPKEWCLTRRDCHPSVAAHHLAADAVADFLGSAGLGPAAVPATIPVTAPSP